MLVGNGSHKATVEQACVLQTATSVTLYIPHISAGLGAPTCRLPNHFWWRKCSLPLGMLDCLQKTMFLSSLSLSAQRSKVPVYVFRVGHPQSMACSSNLAWDAFKVIPYHLNYLPNKRRCLVGNNYCFVFSPLFSFWHGCFL